jgi:hypothetical protein
MSFVRNNALRNAWYCSRDQISLETNLHKLIDLSQDKIKVAVLAYEKILSDTHPDLLQQFDLDFKSLRHTFEYVKALVQSTVPSHLHLQQYKSIAHIIFDAINLLYEIERKQYEAEQNRLKMEKTRLKMERRFKQTRVLKKSLMEKPIEDCCGICLETHLKKDTVQTSCGHCFGAECYERMLDLDGVRTPRKNICPMCRTKAPKLTYWRLPAPRKPRCCKQPNQTSTTTTTEEEQHTSTL